MLILDSLPERQEATGLPLGTQMLAEPFLRACFTTITLALAHTILEPFLSPIGTGSLSAHQRARRSPRHTWTMQIAVQGTSSTHQQQLHSSEASTNHTKS